MIEFVLEWWKALDLTTERLKMEKREIGDHIAFDGFGGSSVAGGYPVE